MCVAAFSSENIPVPESDYDPSCPNNLLPAEKGGTMHRRLGFIVSMCGMVFVLLPLATTLQYRDLVVCSVGFGFVLMGVFFAIESVARQKDKK